MSSDYSDDFDDNIDDIALSKAEKAGEEHIAPRMLEMYSHKLNFELQENLYVDKARDTIEQNDLKRKALKPGKDMRRTEEQVLDNRTKVVLFKLLNRKILGDIEGCISTGKEGNIYIGHRGEEAPSDWPKTFAIKIFKTCILKFKDRARYVTGEQRFKHHSRSKNSRKAVILWSEKEFRNLSRLYNNGVLCPRPLLVKHNIIFMELISIKDMPAPTLRLADLSTQQLETFYFDLCKTLRYIYHHCGLVHADLSEYNILVKKNDLYIIDVGQAVETDNHNATVFLRNDIAVITRFFKSRGVQVAPMLRLFEFIVDPQLYSKEEEVLLDIMQQKETISAEEFTGVYIPQRLDQVADPELEIADLEDGYYDNAAYHGAFTGVIPTFVAADEIDLARMAEEEEEEEEEEEDGEEEDKKEKKETLDRKNFTKQEWKEMQKKIKEERREKRLTKTPKYQKRKAYRKAHPNAK